MRTDLIESNLKFLSRATLRGDEVAEFTAVVGALTDLAAANAVRTPPKSVRPTLSEPAGMPAPEGGHHP